MKDQTMTKTRTAKIIELHNEIAGHMKMSVELAIKIGGLLTKQKAGLNHGKWLPWIEENLPFSHDTAKNYMRAWKYRKVIKKRNIRNLTDAYEAAHTEVWREDLKRERENRKAKVKRFELRYIGDRPADWNDKEEKEYTDLPSYGYGCFGKESHIITEIRSERNDQRRQGEIPYKWGDAEETEYLKESAERRIDTRREQFMDLCDISADLPKRPVEWTDADEVWLQKRMTWLRRNHMERRWASRHKRWKDQEKVNWRPLGWTEEDETHYQGWIVEQEAREKEDMKWNYTGPDWAYMYSGNDDSLRLAIPEYDKQQRAIFKILETYLSNIDDDNMQLEATQNLIKKLKRRAIGQHKKIYEKPLDPMGASLEDKPRMIEEAAG